MPTVLRIGPYRFLFYASDRREPPHVHVERDNNIAKFWLEPVRLHEINNIRKLVEENRGIILGRWHEFFND